MRLLIRLLWIAVFFALFAFALNNQQAAVIHWFFGIQWQGPMVFVVLAVFGLGCLCGVLAMTPYWWRSRRGLEPRGAARAAGGPDGRPANETPPLHPPRDGV
jgi:putative membrane protein